MLARYLKRYYKPRISGWVDLHRECQEGVRVLIVSKGHSFNEGSLALTADHIEHQFGQRRGSTQMAHCWKLPATAGREAESVGQQAMRVPLGREVQEPS
jgi:hypothetical protein